MMGVRQQELDLFTYSVNLDERVRPEHPLRQVTELVDFTFVRDLVSHTYGRTGHRSEDPAVVLKMMFLLFWDDVASELLLMRTIPERLDYLGGRGQSSDLLFSCSAKANRMTAPVPTPAKRQTSRPGPAPRIAAWTGEAMSFVKRREQHERTPSTLLGTACFVCSFWLIDASLLSPVAATPGSVGSVIARPAPSDCRASLPGTVPPISRMTAPPAPNALNRTGSLFRD